MTSADTDDVRGDNARPDGTVLVRVPDEGKQLHFAMLRVRGFAD